MYIFLGMWLIFFNLWKVQLEKFEDDQFKKEEYGNYLNLGCCLSKDGVRVMFEGKKVMEQGLYRGAVGKIVEEQNRDLIVEG